MDKPALGDRIWRAPLVPVALAFSAGIVLDRYRSLPLPGSLFAVVVALAAWTATLTGRSRGLPLVYLVLATFASGAAWHHYRRDILPTDDISLLVEEKPRLVQLRGLLDDEPEGRYRRSDPLRSVQGADIRTKVVLQASAYRPREEWLPVSGQVELWVSGALSDLHAGDTVEAVGRLEAPQKPANPGERDMGREMRDQGIRAVLRVQGGGDGVTRLEPAGFWSLRGWRAYVRGWGVRVVGESLPRKQAGLAAALLLGVESMLDREEWDRYKRTGVVHVLVISGQHLVILGIYLCCWRGLTSVRERRLVVVVVLFLWAYTFLTGLRPSSLRAAVTATAFAGGVLLRRPVFAFNTLALAWLVVVFLNPTDANGVGCQLSFVCVACLYWNSARERAAWVEPDPMEQAIEDSRPLWQRILRWLGHLLLADYLLTVCMWLVVAPLIVSRMHIVPYLGLLIGPPVVLLTSLALITGFLLLLAAALFWPLVPVFAWLTGLFLGGCDWLVNLCEEPWVKHLYVADVPGWWVGGFYLMLGVGLLLEPSRRHWRWALLAGVGWLGVGFLAAALRSRTSDELRVTFLAVGHGGCTVIETPDGRTLLYDAGSLRGPDAGRWLIAPFLWHRGIRRIDEVFLSHADLDHFNGLRDLAERFTIGQVTCTPTFSEKNNAAVRETLNILEKVKVPVRIVSRGDRLAAGAVTIDVLHPPKSEPLKPDPPGVENVRSLTLLVSHGRHRILLTGDLEGAGLALLLKRDPIPVDVLMAPHHGSRRVEGAVDLMKWAQPRVVVACQREPRTASRLPDPYLAAGVQALGTWPHGAITIRSHTSGLVIETFVTKERIVVRSSNRAEGERREPAGK